MTGLGTKWHGERVFVYLKGNVCVDVPETSDVRSSGDEFHCLGSNGRILARFDIGDVLMYSHSRIRVQPDAPLDDRRQAEPSA